ncbi:serine threonine protein kinase [Pyrenophora tritici-repentis]|nr:serine threonine protein kinase [Pyrenophora tritici-repentis]KAI1524010.1 SPS1 Serine threonine protein kinase [Pyrenophora tritici-repentis]KAI1560407.1 SPS1 Serine threonine protein kinase [Pyrenophora tritici-repentis]KAI1564150.1 SPS1 Serine threonine protein kinase [Pyrenophora tritici-repentis]KAI1678735.1 serine threonine protein kinase [Pyrenophora tritici-repentis]
MSHDCCSIRIFTQELRLTIETIDKTVFKVRLVQDAQINISPESQLPQDLVIKPLTKDPDAEYMDRMETLVYKRLSHLQGRHIPRYYGIGDFRYEGKTVKAHVLERVNGSPLTEIDKADWNKLDIEHKITEAYTELSKQGLIHADVEARHIFFIDEAQPLMLIDFGLAEFCDCEDAKAQNTNDVEGLMRDLDE